MIFFSESKQLPWKRKWSFHAKLYPGEPLQAGDGTKKFLFHSMIVMICCKITSCVLIFMFYVKEFLTMNNVFKVYDYQTCLSIKPRIILQGFCYFSSWTIIKLPFNFDFFRTYFSDWSNNVQIIRYFINTATQNCVIELYHLNNCLNMNIFISFNQVFKQISLHYSIYFDSFNWKLRNYVVCILYFI